MYPISVEYMKNKPMKANTGNKCRFICSKA